MPFFNSSSSFWSNSKLPAFGPVRTSSAPRKPEAYGWFDSSMDLAQGLEVVEQDNDTLYQLWQLARG